jgi:hypothetical protein
MEPAPESTAFTDAKGRAWQLELNYGLARRIKKDLGVDFANAHNGEALKKLGTDDELLVSTLYALIEEQAKTAEISPDQFVEALNGEVLEAAANAIGAMIVLFTRPAIRPVIQSLLDKAQQGRAKLTQMALGKMQGPEVTAAIDREVEQVSRRIDAELTASNSSTAIS